MGEFLKDAAIALFLVKSSVHPSAELVVPIAALAVSDAVCAAWRNRRN
jgi:hypothetical protein